MNISLPGEGGGAGTGKRKRKGEGRAIKEEGEGENISRKARRKVVERERLQKNCIGLPQYGLKMGHLVQS